MNDAAEMADFLRSHGFETLTVHHADREARAQITFRLAGLSGVHIPWLEQAVHGRGWHVEKVENCGGATVTVAQGTDPYIPGPAAEGAA